MAKVDELFARINECIDVLHDQRQFNELDSHRGQVRNVMNRLRAIRPFATGSRSAPCSPCLVDLRHSNDLSPQRRLSNDHLASMLNDRRRRPLSLGSVGKATLASYHSSEWRREKTSSNHRSHDTDKACRSQTLHLHRHALDICSPTPTLTDAQVPALTIDHRTSSPTNDANLRPNENSSVRARRGPAVLAAGAGMNLRSSRKRRHREDVEAVTSHTPDNNTSAVGDRDAHAAKRRKITKKSHSETNITLSELAYKFGERKNIKDMEDIVAALVSSENVGAQAYLLQRKEFMAALKNSAADMAQLMPAVIREIESNDEDLSRLRHRLALSDFYQAYTSAQNKPIDFLKQVDAFVPQAVKLSTSLDWHTPTKIKQYFIAIIFQDSRRSHVQDCAKKIDNWRSGGLRWHMLIERFGVGILLLAPEGLTNNR